MPTDMTDGDTSDDVGIPSDNTTLTAVIAGFEREGYKASFGARDGGRLHCSSCRQESAAREFEVDEVRRLEGASDPDAQSMLAAATCPACGTRGTAVFGYGPEASEVDALVIADLDVDPED